MGTLGDAHATPSMDLAKRKELGQGYFGKYRKKSGVVEADKSAAQIIKGKEQKAWVKEVLGKKTVFSPENLDKWSGHGANPELNDLNKYYRQWEQNDKYVKYLDQHLRQKPDFNPDNLEKWIGRGPNKELDNLNEMYRIAENESDYLKKLGQEGKKINWAKWGKWGAVALGAAALIGLGIWGVKKYRENQEEQANNAQAQQPINNVEQPDSTATGAVIPPIGVVPGDSTVVGINPPVAPAEPDTPAVEPTPVHNPNSVVDQDGNMTVKKGDGLWHIAKRYIEEKYANEPEKYENLSKAEQDKLIWKEVHRIAELNDFELVTKFINGKEVIVTSPMIHAGDKVKVVETETLAA